VVKRQKKRRGGAAGIGESNNQLSTSVKGSAMARKTATNIQQTASSAWRDGAYGGGISNNRNGERKASGVTPWHNGVVTA